MEKENEKIQQRLDSMKQAMDLEDEEVSLGLKMFGVRGWPVYEVKCLCSRGQELGREGCHSH